jgi:hypothetical protein
MSEYLNIPKEFRIGRIKKILKNMEKRVKKKKY